MIKLINDECLKTIKTFNDETIDLTITSPPYDDLRNYNSNFDIKEIAKERINNLESKGE